METRRKHHRMYAFHKIVFNLSPPYLRNCIPSYVRDISSYQLRDAEALRTIPCRLDLFYKSFFPLAVREWNLLPPALKTIQDHEKFKIALQKSLPVSNKLYSYGKRKCNIIHSRLRLGCSELNAHLNNNHLIENPKCACGDDSVDSFHYFFVCPAYAVERDVLLNTVSTISGCTITTVLYGSKACTLEENCIIFKHVHTFIETTKTIQIGNYVFVVSMATSKWTAFRENLCEQDQSHLLQWQINSLPPKWRSRIFRYVILNILK